MSSIVVTVGVVTPSIVLFPDGRAVSRLRGAITLSDELAIINNVSQWPAEWVAAVCDPSLYPLRKYTRLPHAKATASCRSHIRPLEMWTT
jgi:hypothetical protein